MWDDESRGRALRLTEYGRSLCGCGCGLPRSVAHDPSQIFEVDKTICYAARARASVARKEQQAAEDQRRPEGWDEHLFYYAIPIDDDRKGD